MIEESVRGYLEGEKEKEQVISEIENKIKLYLAEKE